MSLDEFPFKVRLKNGEMMLLKDYPWYLKDRFGWPIERTEHKPIQYIIKIMLQNIRKIIHI